MEFVSNIMNVTLEGIIDATLHAVKEFASQSAWTIANQVLAGLNQLFSIYYKYINPPNRGIGDLQEELAATEKEIAETAIVRPDGIDTVNKELDDPYNNWMDIPEKMQLMPYHMTTGKNVVLMSKYYDSGY